MLSSLFPANPVGNEKRAEGTVNHSRSALISTCGVIECFFAVGCDLSGSRLVGARRSASIAGRIPFHVRIFVVILAASWLETVRSSLFHHSSYQDTPCPIRFPSLYWWPRNATFSPLRSKRECPSSMPTAELVP